LTGADLASKLRMAHRNALNSIDRFKAGQQQFLKVLQESAGDAPPALGIAHSVRYNADLEATPLISIQGRRGFLKLSRLDASIASVDWKKMDDPVVCAYAWGVGINKTGQELWKEYAVLFPAPDADFWNVTYLRYLVGKTVFDILWGYRDDTQPKVLDSIIYGGVNITKSIPGWGVDKMRTFLFYSLPFVAFLWPRGGRATSGGYGKLPTPPITTAITARLE